MARPVLRYFATGKPVLPVMEPEKSQDIGKSVESVGVGATLARLCPHLATSVTGVALCLAEGEVNQARDEEGGRYIFTLTKGRSPADSDISGNEITTHQTETSNSSASATITITMTGALDE